MREVEFRWYKKLRWCFVVAALMIATLYASSASAGPEHLAVQMQQRTANPVLTRAAVNYRVMVLNTGTVAQDNVQVRVSFPGSLWGIPASGVGANCTYAGGGGAPTASVTCTAGRLASGASRTFDVQIIAPSIVIYDGSQPQFTITAGLNVNGALPGTGGADATATVATNVLPLPDLNPQWSGPLTITAGRDAAYTVRVRNTGDGLAAGVSARIILPREVDFVRLLDSTFRSCPRTGQEINCSELVIQPGREASVRIIVRPLQLIMDGTKVLLSVGADPSGTVRERRENNNTAFIMPTVRAEADLSITGTFRFLDSHGTERCRANDRYMFAYLKIRNNGPGASLATTLRVDWLGGRALTTCGQGLCDIGCECGEANNPSDCPPPSFFNTASVPVLSPGTEITIKVEAVRDKPGFGQNDVGWGTVTLDPNNLVNDPNRQNNSWVMYP